MFLILSWWIMGKVDVKKSLFLFCLQNHHLSVYSLCDWSCGQVCGCHSWCRGQHCSYVSFFWCQSRCSILLRPYSKSVSSEISISRLEVQWNFLLLLFLHRVLSLVGLVLIALGTGGIKPCVAAFGGDQFDEENVSHDTKLYQLLFTNSVKCNAALIS